MRRTGATTKMMFAIINAVVERKYKHIVIVAANRQIALEISHRVTNALQAIGISPTSTNGTSSTISQVTISVSGFPIDQKRIEGLSQVAVFEDNSTESVYNPATRCEHNMLLAMLCAREDNDYYTITYGYKHHRSFYN